MSEKTWRVIPPRDETRAFNIIEFIDDDFGTHIAEVYDEDSVNLIAAAPEMYKILDGLIYKLKANGADEREEIDEAIQEIERLIERIDGEEAQE